MRTIKRYNNRKLYDPTDSRYVNLSDLILYVKQGIVFEIINSELQVITSETLAMAISRHIETNRLAIGNTCNEFLVNVIKAF